MARILALLFLVLHLCTYGQNHDQTPDIELGTIWFKGKSTKLTGVAKASLDKFVQQIQSNPAMHVKAVSFNKDFCNQCGVRSWTRATTVLRYLSERGIAKDRFRFTNRLEGELNKMDLYLTFAIPNNTPAPIIRTPTSHTQEK